MSLLPSSSAARAHRRRAKCWGANAWRGCVESSVRVTKRTATTFEAGAAFDFTLLPLIDLGHGSYNVLLPRDNYASFNWYLLGLHVALEF